MQNKTILVTGAAGSIGSALCHTLMKLKPKKLIMLDQDETGIFDLEEEVGGVGVVANIRDKEAIERVFHDFKPEVVFHAAAMKHVVMCERYPDEAVKTNLEAFDDLVNIAVKHKVKKFVFISSDKAVYPKCLMGETKRIGELICLKLNGTTKFIIVRFGNVMPSRGSVVPIFKKQVEESKSLTVTHPKMKRYFMGIYDAVGLVVEAAQKGKGGEIFVLDMGEPIFITDLAKMMIKLSGKPLDIVYTKVGKNEKFSEVLMTEEEKGRAVKKGKLYIIK